MKKSRKTESDGLTRRDLLKASGVALGGLALGSVLVGSRAGKVNAQQMCSCPPGPTCNWTDYAASQRYSYFQTLKPFYPFNKHTETNITPLGKNEMRITFMGSVIPVNMRKTQQLMSVFVEVGWDKEKQMPLDQFVFDCGAGVLTNYNAMNVNLGRMNKIFINHLHGDHMSDLTYMYCFGPSQGRTSPLYVFGPNRSGLTSPDYQGRQGQNYDDGTKAFCENLRRACRWHTESFSFQTTMYEGYPTQDQIRAAWGLKNLPVPVEEDPWGDAYCMVPIELDWMHGGVAYDNPTTGVKISYFPVIHCRKGSVGYKLDWKTPRGETLSMIYSSDTSPSERIARFAHASQVLIHEASGAAPGHSSAGEAGWVARRAGVDKLFIIHYPANSSGLDWLLAEARQQFSGRVELARDLEAFEF